METTDAPNIETANDAASTPALTQRDGVIDRLFNAVEGLPGPAPLYFLLFGVVLAIVGHVIVWATGQAPPGTWSNEIVAATVLTGYFLALGSFMRSTADGAFDEFRPVLGDTAVEDVERHRLLAVPDAPAAVAGIAMLIFTSAVFTAIVKPTLAPRPPVLDLVITVAWLLFSFMLGVVVVQTLTQLRAVSHLSSIAKRIDIFDAAPVDGLSRVTSVASIGLLVFVALANLAAPENSAAYIGLDVAVIVLALLAFIVPLRVMHQRLREQKANLQTQSAARLRRVLGNLHAAIDDADTTAADAVNKMVSTALAERDLLARLSTWPWTTTTLRGVGTALLLPIVIFVVTRVIDRVL